VTPLVESDGARSGAPVRVALRVALPEGLHTQSNKPRDANLIPTVLTIDAPAGISVDEIVFPPSTDLKQAGQEQALAVFEREFAIGVRLTVAGSVAPGTITVPARLRYQACDANLCYAPATAETSWTLRVVSATSTVTPAHRDVFDKIAFGRGEAPAQTIAPVAPRPAPGAAAESTAGDLAAIDDFTVRGSAGG